MFNREGLLNFWGSSGSGEPLQNKASVGKLTEAFSF
jgi:hypothetical protein